MNDTKSTRSFWARVWHHSGFHGDDKYTKNLERKDALPILFVLIVVAISIGLLLYIII
jgi:hypothetical protein